MATTRREWHPYQPTTLPAPGETLRETLEELGLTQSNFATRTGLTLKHINQIVRGRAAISPETAVAFERSTDVPATFWNALEANYQDHNIRSAEADSLAKHAEWLDQMPISELRKLGHVTVDKRQPGVLLQEVLKFFGVANIEAWRETWQAPAAAFFQSNAFDVDIPATAAWLRLGELDATHIHCQPFDRTGLRQAVPHLRSLTTQSPKEFYPELIRTCGEVGVAVVLVPGIPGTRARGAARFLAPSKALIQLSNRHKTNDHFWFAFFHEIGHLLLHSKKQTFIRFEGKEQVQPEVEQEANEFAGDLLIPVRYDARILAIETPADATALADELGIHPGIVAGRYRRETQNWSFAPGLFAKFEIVRK